MHLKFDHDLIFLFAKTREFRLHPTRSPQGTSIISRCIGMIFLHLDVDLEILGHGWLGNRFYLIRIFSNKSMSHERDMASTAMMRLDCLPINLGFTDELFEVVIKREVCR